MIKNYLLTCLYISIFANVSFTQSPGKPIYEIEKEAYSSYFENVRSDYKSDTNINVNYYKLNLTITYSPNFITGDVTINSLGLVNNLNTIFYDLSDDLTVDSIIHNNQSLSFAHSQNIINISLPGFFQIQELISVRIFYHGVPVPTGFGSFVFGSHNVNEPAIWTLSEPFGSSDWFPCKNVPSDKADSSDTWLRCSNMLTAVSNGSLQEIVNNNDGTLTFKWHNSYPIANYLISLAISNYSQYNFYYKYSSADSMPVLNYIYPENLDKLKPQLDKTKQMLLLFSQKYGPYPFLNEKYGHAEFGRLAGMEHQTISSMGAFNDNIIAHELTHQWFGDKITCRNWENIWLNEGFATYGEAIYNEAVNGKNAYNEFIKFRMTDAKTAVGSIYVQDVNSISQIFSGNRSYAKGCVVLHMLRGIVGDSTYFDIIRAYTSDTSVTYKTAVTEDFQKVAGSVSGQNLNYFFQEWIYGENYPKYNVSWTVEKLVNDQYKATVNIVQDANSNPSYFTMPVQIKIFTPNNKDTTFNVFNKSLLETFVFILNRKPLDFRIDPDNLILKEVRGENIVPVSFLLQQNYPNPFNPKTNISYQLGKPSSVKLVIYDILGQKVAILKSEMEREGNYSIEFDGAALPSGIYFYKLEVYDFENINMLYEDTKKMILLK